MKLPVPIHFAGIARSEALEAAIHARAAHLDHLCPGIITCRASVSEEAGNAQQRRSFSVRLDVTLPSQEIVVTHVHEQDVYVALRDAFDAMKRRVEDATQIRRGEVKQHATRSGGA